jgi:hypothetical protein
LRVIEHTPEQLVTFMAESTVVSVPMLADGRGLRDVPLDERSAAKVRAEGERVIASEPWPTGWEDWRPPSDWGPLELPEDWDVV